MRRLFARILLAASLAPACSPTPNALPSNDFNRPTDLTFMCLGAFDPGASSTPVDGGTTGPLRVSGRPMDSCHPSGIGPGNLDKGATVTTRTFAFMPNRSRPARTGAV